MYSRWPDTESTRQAANSPSRSSPTRKTAGSSTGGTAGESFCACWRKACRHLPVWSGNRNPSATQAYSGISPTSAGKDVVLGHDGNPVRNLESPGFVFFARKTYAGIGGDDHV